MTKINYNNNNNNNNNINIKNPSISGSGPLCIGIFDKKSLSTIGRPAIDKWKSKLVLFSRESFLAVVVVFDSILPLSSDISPFNCYDNNGNNYHYNYNKY